MSNKALFSLLANRDVSGFDESNPYILETTGGPVLVKTGNACPTEFIS